MRGHAILSASGAHRWMACTPSARLELEFEDNSGEAAAEGTAAAPGRLTTPPAFIKLRGHAGIAQLVERRIRNA